MTAPPRATARGASLDAGPGGRGTAPSAIVVGGGITGLVAAHALAARGVHVTVLEADDRVGGVVRTAHDGAFTADLGPNTIVETAPVRALLAELGLGDRVVRPGAEAARRYLVRDGRAHAVPASPLDFARTPLLSPAAKLRVLAEPLRRSRVAADDESVADCIRRHFGAEVLDRIVAPALGGVHAADADRLSARAVLGATWERARDRGSLVRALLQGARQRRAAGEARPRSIALDAGLDLLPAALAAALGDAVVTGARVEAIERRDGAWTVRATVAGTAVVACADAVVCAVPARSLAGVRMPARAAERLQGVARIAHAPLAVVALAFARADVAHPLDGFGALVPPTERRALLGALFTSTLVPGRAPADTVLLTCFAGGATNPGAAHLDPAALERAILGDLREVLGVRGRPVAVLHAPRVPTIPQPAPGHAALLADVARAEAALPGLHLAGSWRSGVSLPACIGAARALGARVADEAARAAAARRAA